MEHTAYEMNRCYAKKHSRYVYYINMQKYADL